MSNNLDNLHVIKDISRPSKDLIQELAGLDTATVHEASGGRGALSSDIKPIRPEMRVCGSALTVACRPGDNLMLHKAIYVAKPGDVLVVTVGGYLEAGYWGEVMAFAAKERGISGLVIDGSVRDTRSLIEMSFPAFSKGISIKGTTKDSLGLINHPIQIGGVTVHPGDAVLGDGDGVVIVARQDLAEVIKKSRMRMEKEEAVMQKIKEGKPLFELVGLDRVLQAKGLKEA